MKKAVLLVTFFVIFLSVPAHAMYVIDGFIDDWGVTLNASSQFMTYLDTNTPTSPTVSYFTEDNTDNWRGWQYVGPGYSLANRYDAEAIYLDSDPLFAYIAVVTGTSKTEASFPPGDIFINVDGAPGYPGFGIDINTGKLYEANSWQEVLYPAHSATNPWKIGANRTFLGDIDFVYSGEQYTHYVMEAKVPFSLLGLSGGQHDITAQWTMQCGNDFVKVDHSANVIPEPGSLSLLGFGLMSLLGFRRKQLF